MRTNINFKLVCRECGNELVAAESQPVPITFDNDNEVTVKLRIVPCRVCQEKLTKPLQTLKEALTNLREFNL
jgi:hypothetical protein